MIRPSRRLIHPGSKGCGFHRRRLGGATGIAALSLLANGGLPLPAAAEERTLVSGFCELEDAESGRVVEIHDATTIGLDDGRLIHLAAIATPPNLTDPSDASPELEQVLGTTVRFAVGDVEDDRYGRVVAHVFDADGTWLQAAIIENGHAVVAATLGDRQCLAELLAFERVARSEARGLWAEHAVPNAWSAAIRAGDDRFALIEGEVVSVGRTETTVYLNFGHDWSSDLTVTFGSPDADMVEAESGPLDALVGAVIRVRGWLSQRDGPWIRVDHGEQIEVLSGGDAGAAN